MRRKFRLPLRGREWLLFATSLILAVLIWFLSNLSRTYSGVLGVPVIAECNIQGREPAGPAGLSRSRSTGRTSATGRATVSSSRAT